VKVRLPPFLPHKGLVERIQKYPIMEAAWAAILAEIEAVYRRERAELDRPEGLKPTKLLPTA